MLTSVVVIYFFWILAVLGHEKIVINNELFIAFTVRLLDETCCKKKKMASRKRRMPARVEVKDRIIPNAQSNTYLFAEGYRIQQKAIE